VTQSYRVYVLFSGYDSQLPLPDALSGDGFFAFIMFAIFFRRDGPAFEERFAISNRKSPRGGVLSCDNYMFFIRQAGIVTTMSVWYVRRFSLG